jgi:hypothetical protein
VALCLPTWLRFAGGGCSREWAKMAHLWDDTPGAAPYAERHRPVMHAPSPHRGVSACAVGQPPECSWTDSVSMR